MSASRLSPTQLAYQLADSFVVSTSLTVTLSVLLAPVVAAETFYQHLSCKGRRALESIAGALSKR